MKVVDFAKVAKLNLMKIGGFFGTISVSLSNRPLALGKHILRKFIYKTNYSYSVVCRIKQVVCLKTPEFDVILLT